MLTWPTSSGKTYDVLAASELGQDWRPINGTPIVDAGGSARFVDPAVGISRFYLVVERGVGQSLEIALDSLRISPARANLPPGGKQIFRVTGVDVQQVRWSIEAMGDDVVGTMTPSGLFTAPPTLPATPVVLIRATRTTDSRSVGFAVVTLQPESELEISREQAIEILLREVVSGLPTTDDVAVFGSHSTLGPEDLVRPYRQLEPSGGTMVEPQTMRGAVGGSWLFLVDRDPLSGWVHPVLHVLVEARSGQITSQSASWYPVVNGLPAWNQIIDRLASHDLVHLGATLAGTMPASAALSPSPNRALSGLAGEVLSHLTRIFPPDPQACECSGGRRYHAVISVLSPEERPLRNSAYAMEKHLKSSGFNVTTLTYGGAIQLLASLNETRKSVRPCDVLVVMVLGHGEHGTVGNMQPASWVPIFRAIPTNAKYLIAESCDAGWLPEIYQNAGSKEGVPQVTILTASNKVNFDAPIMIAGTSPIWTLAGPFGGPSGFTDALIAGFSHHDTLEGAHGALTTFTEIGGTALRMKAADPQLIRVGDPDSDHDGIVDKTEIAFGFDPHSPDSDGDGVCDGAEWALLPSGHIAERRALSIISPTSLGDALVGEGLDISLRVTNAIFGNTRRATEANPFTQHARYGWVIAAGSELTPFLAIDRITGVIYGGFSSESRPRAGPHRFTVEYMDAAGARVSKEFSLYVHPYTRTEPSRILVTTTRDGNVRDDDISLREATLLASGRLRPSELRPDPDLKDGKSEGELRWIQGFPGRDTSERIELYLYRGEVAGFSLDGSLGPLVFDGSHDFLTFPVGAAAESVTIRSSQGPILLVGGSRQEVSGIFFEVKDGPAIIVTGASNYLARLRVIGNGAGDGLRFENDRNVLAASEVSAFETGIRITAAGTRIASAVVTDCGDGIALDGGASQNQIISSAVGFRFDWPQTVPISMPLRGVGIRISGGAHHNEVLSCDVAGCKGGGILVDGEGSDRNYIKSCRVGDRAAGGDAVAVGGNGLFGIGISGGASSNSVVGGILSGNLGPGVVIRDPGTDANSVEGDYPLQVTVAWEDRDGMSPPLRITSVESGVDALRIEAGASANRVTADILGSGRDGAVISGSGTRSNVVSVIVRQATSAGIRIEAGASGNILQYCSVTNSGHGLLIEGIGTKENTVRETTVGRNAGDGIRVSAGAVGNVVGSGVDINANGGHGFVCEGAGTEGNAFEGKLIQVRESVAVGIVFRDGARGNSVSGATLSGNRGGSGLFTGRGTIGNALRDCVLGGGLSSSTVAFDSTGARFSDGASGNRISSTTISYHGLNGVDIVGGDTVSNVVVGCTIFSNRGAGVSIDGSAHNRIGTEAAGNLVLSGGGAGVRIAGPAAAFNRVQGNQIGRTTLPSRGLHGVHVLDGAHDNLIGGSRPVQASEASPAILLRPLVADTGSGNWIVGHQGDGVRIEGADTRDNRVQGNLIGYPVETTGARNLGDGISLRAGATRNTIGNRARADANTPRHGNVIVASSGHGVRLEGVTTRANTVRRNEIHSTPANRLSLLEGANDGPIQFTVAVSWQTGVIRGQAPGPGIIEIFSDFPGDMAVYHLAAEVGAGSFALDSVNPAKSQNARIVDRQRPVRRAAYWVTFTDLTTGSTSAAIIIE